MDGWREREGGGGQTETETDRPLNKLERNEDAPEGSTEGINLL